MYTFPILIIVSAPWCMHTCSLTRPDLLKSLCVKWILYECRSVLIHSLRRTGGGWQSLTHSHREYGMVCINHSHTGWIESSTIWKGNRVHTCILIDQCMIIYWSDWYRIPIITWPKGIGYCTYPRTGGVSWNVHLVCFLHSASKRKEVEKGKKYFDFTLKSCWI